MSKIKIATAPCSWGVWYADGKPSSTPYNVFLDQAAQAGYKGLELGPDGYLPTDLGQLREELAKRDLEACAGTACYEFMDYKKLADFKDRIDALCGRLQSLGSKYLVTMDGSNVGEPWEKNISKDSYKTLFQMFKDLGEYTREQYGVEVVFHPHVKTAIETEEEIVNMMDYSGLNLCFDTGHHAYANGNAEMNERSAIDFMIKYADKMKYLHFKNVDLNVFKKVKEERMTSDDAFDQDVMCDLADGIINFKDLKKTLDQIQFSGIAVIEQDMPRATTEQAFAAAKRNLEYLKAIDMI